MCFGRNGALTVWSLRIVARSICSLRGMMWLKMGWMPRFRPLLQVLIWKCPAKCSASTWLRRYARTSWISRLSIRLCVGC
ncbi:hypothetical protein D3C77_432600 [compost metagenome]